MAAGTTNGRCVVPPETHDGSTNSVNRDQETQGTVCQQFSTIDAVFVVISLLTYVLDLVTDCLLTWQYFSSGHPICGVWTLVFIVVPTLTLQLLSVRWYITEKRKLCCSWTLVAHLFCLGPVQRYISVLRHGRNARLSNSPEAYKRLYQAQNDVSTLRFIEAYMESAPQLILQGYFILTVQPITWVSGLSTAVSLVSLAWAVASYSNALRLAYRDSYVTKWAGMLVQTLWHICILASRVVAIIVFASVFHAWTFLTVGLHWVAMSIWVFLQDPEFFPLRWENKLFSLVLGVVYIFCFLNLKDGRTRYKMWPFYVLLLAENGLLVGLWYRERPTLDTLMIVVTAVVFGGYLMGVFFLLLYYGWCHPSGSIHLCRDQKSEVKAETSQQVGTYRMTVFDTSVAAHSAMVSHSGYDLSLDSSWSGLVPSRRGDNTTYATSKFRTSSRQLNFESNNVAGRPSDVCTKVFDTPLCGLTTGAVGGLCRQHSKTSGLLILSDSGEGSQSYHLSDTCIVCSTRISGQNSVGAEISSSSNSSGGMTGSPLGCASLAHSTDLHSASNGSAKLTFDNAAFSAGSLNSIASKSAAHRRVLHPAVKAMDRATSTPALSTSLPALHRPSTSNLHVDKPSSTLPRKQSSVYAVTGIPKQEALHQPKVLSQSRQFTPLYQKNSRDAKLQLTSRVFDHTQSLQCIPCGSREQFESHTLPLKPRQSNNKIRMSGESLSSVCSNIRPRPLSPLNAQALWEESMVRFHKSFELDNSNTNQSAHSANSSVQPVSLVDSHPIFSDRRTRVSPNCKDDRSHPHLVLSPGNSEIETSASLQMSRIEDASLLSSSSYRNNATTSPQDVSDSTESSSVLSSASRAAAQSVHSPRTVGTEQKHTPNGSCQADGITDESGSSFSAGGYRTESSGFQSSSVDESCDFFDYSDDARNQSKHTLSDLAQRLTVALDLNSTNSNLSSVSKGTDQGDLRKVIHPELEYPLAMLYKDTPWRMDYQSRIPTPILRQSLLSLYSASELSLSQASEVNFRSGLAQTSVFHGEKGFCSEYQTNAYPVSGPLGQGTSNSFDAGCIKHHTPLKIYNLAKSPGGGGRRSAGLHPHVLRRKGELNLELEQYGTSPYKFQHCRKGRDSPTETTGKISVFEKKSPVDCSRVISLRSPEEPKRNYGKGHKQRSPLPLTTRYSKSPGRRGRYENTDSSSDSGRQSSDFNSSGSIWEGISYSDNSENLDPSLLSSRSSRPTPATKRADMLPKTPDFSPIDRPDLPPLTVGTAHLAPGQSYFSTPKAHFPGLNSPSVVTDHDNTDDSFFGVRVPRMSGRRSKNSSLMPRHGQNRHENIPHLQYTSVKHVGVHLNSRYNRSADSSNSSVTNSVSRSPLQSLNSTTYI